HARLLAPDLPGYGGSPLGDTAPTPEGYRTWLLAFLDAAGIQTAVVVGMSLGGGVALRTALDAPARVARLVLLAPYGVSPRLPGRKSGCLPAPPPPAARRPHPGGPPAKRPAPARQPACPAPPARRGQRRAGRPGAGPARPPRRRGCLVCLPAARGVVDPAPHLPHRAARR